MCFIIALGREVEEVVALVVVITPTVVPLVVADHTTNLQDFHFQEFPKDCFQQLIKKSKATLKNCINDSSQVRLDQEDSNGGNL